MATFNSLAELADHLGGSISRLHTELESAMSRIAADALQRAQAKPGTYQSDSGPFPSWLPLSPFTMEERTRLGFSPNDPLLRTGELRDSYQASSDALSASIGSPLQKAYDMEFGNPENAVPDRPVVGPAMWEGGLVQGQMLVQAIGNALRA